MREPEFPATQPAPRWHLLLGSAPVARRPDGSTESLAVRDAALLAWLALEGPTSRARAAELLWPASAPESAGNNLRQRLFQLRRQLGAELVSGGSTLALVDGVAHDLNDADTVLGDLADSIGPAFDAWLEQQRMRRRDRMRMSLVELCEMAERASDWPDALAHAQELLALEPHSEAAHRRLMRLHYLGGDRAAALMAFDRCEQLLKDEVGARPSAETLALLETINSAQVGRAVALGQAVPASVLRPPRMIGRAPEMARLEQAFASDQVVAVIGEAGLGKSRLLQEFAAQRTGTACLVHVAARPGDAGVPFATLARLLRTVAAAGAQRMPEATRREIARVLPEFGDAAAGAAAEGQRLNLQRAVQALLDGSTALHGAMVDDLHFADAASLEMLRALIDCPPDTSPSTSDLVELDSAGHSRTIVAARRWHWVLAYRGAELAAPLQALHDGLVEQARLLPVPLAPLDLGALTQLVESLALPGVDAAALAPGLLRRTGGNPLFVLETLKQAWVERTLDRLADARAMPRPLPVMRLIERRLGQLSAPALALARCAAIAGQSFSVTLATQVLRASPLAITDAWVELEQAHILLDQAFVHDLYHEAALASVPVAIARQLHGEIADWSERGGGAAMPPAALAEHWLASSQPGRALPHLERAAHAAAEALDPLRSAHFWAQVADLHHASGHADAAFLAAQDALNALRSCDTGTALSDAVDRLAALARTPAQRAAALEARGVMFHMRGDAEAAAHWVALGLAELGTDAEPAARAKLLSLHGIVLRRAGRLADAGSALREALTLARTAPAAAADLPAVLNNLALVLQLQDDHLGAIGLLQESAGLQTDALVRARVLNNLGISLEERGQVTQAYEQRLAAARLVAQADNGSMAQSMLAISLGSNAINLARFREAMAHLEHARQLSSSLRHLREEEMHRQYAALWLALGRMNLAREAIEQAEQRSAGDPYQQHAVALVRARYLIAMKQDAAAVLDTAEAGLRSANDSRALRRLLVCKAEVVPPEFAIELMRGLTEAPELQGNAGALIAPQVRSAQAWLRLGAPDRALRQAQRAADWLSGAEPMGMSPAEVWLTLARAADDSHDPDTARMAAQAGQRWVHTVVQQHLDAQYHDGFLRRNAVNAQLIALVARIG